MNSDTLQTRVAELMTPALPIASYKDAALQYHAWGANVTATGDGKHPIHKWKSTPDWTVTRQTSADVRHFPWRNAEGVGIVSGIGGWRVLDFDKCPTFAPVAAFLAGADLPADYEHVASSGSGKGWRVAVLCHEAIPAGILDKGVLIGTPREDGAFKQVELRWKDCQTIMPPSAYTFADGTAGPGYCYVGDTPTEPPIVLTADQVLAGFLAIAEVQRPTPPVEQSHKAYKVSMGEAANERQNASDVIARLNRANDAGDYLEHQGATLIGTRGTTRDYSGLAGDVHGNKITYTVSPAKDGNGHICISHSPNGKLNKIDFPRGFRWFDAICALEYSGVVIGALKALNPIQPRPHAPQPATVYRTVAQVADAERKRAERRAAATSVQNDVRARASQDGELTKADHAVLDTLLTVAGDRDWCRPSKERIAEMCGYALGTVKRSLMILETRGYFVSEGSGGGPNLTAIRTFLRGSFLPEMIHESIPSTDPTLESVLACERAPDRPAYENVYASSLDDWAWSEVDHGADELSELDLPQIAESAEPEAKTDPVSDLPAVALASLPVLDMGEIDRMVAEIQAVADARRDERHEPQSYWEQHEARAWQEARPVAPEPPAVVMLAKDKTERDKDRTRARWDAMRPGQLDRELSVLRNYLISHPAVRWPRWQIAELNARLAAPPPEPGTYTPLPLDDLPLGVPEPGPAGALGTHWGAPPSQAPARRPAQPTGVQVAF